MSTERGGQYVLGPEVRVGDLIEFLGKWHLVERLEPMEGYGIGAQKAFEDSTTWWVSLFPSTPWKVRRPANPMSPTPSTEVAS